MRGIKLLLLLMSVPIRQPVNIENRQKSYPSNQPVHIETSNSFTSMRGYRSHQLDVNEVTVNEVPLEDASAPP